MYRAIQFILCIMLFLLPRVENCQVGGDLKPDEGISFEGRWSFEYIARFGADKSKFHLKFGDEIEITICENLLCVLPIKDKKCMKNSIKLLDHELIDQPYDSIYIMSHPRIKEKYYVNFNPQTDGGYEFRSMSLREKRNRLKMHIFGYSEAYYMEHGTIRPQEFGSAIRLVFRYEGPPRCKRS